MLALFFKRNPNQIRGHMHRLPRVPTCISSKLKHEKKDIEFLDVVALRGPNIWTYRPVLEAWVDIGELEDYPSNTIPGFYERLTEWLPTLIEHRCSPGCGAAS